MTEQPSSSDDISYNLHVLQKMAEQLPDSVRQLFLSQIAKVWQAMAAKEEDLIAKIQDWRLIVATMKFDLEATTDERDRLQRIIDDIQSD